MKNQLSKSFLRTLENEKQFKGNNYGDHMTGNTGEGSMYAHNQMGATPAAGAMKGYGPGSANAKSMNSHLPEQTEQGRKTYGYGHKGTHGSYGLAGDKLQKRYSR